MWKYAEAVREAIVKSNLADITAFVPKRMGVIHVKDLDIEATKEDVADGIGKAIGIQEPHFEVKVHLSDRLSATPKTRMSSSKEAATKLNRIARVRIGWVHCRVCLEERKGKNATALGKKVILHSFAKDLTVAPTAASDARKSVT